MELLGTVFVILVYLSLVVVAIGLWPEAFPGQLSDRRTLALKHVARFLRLQAWKLCGTSAVVLAPCFWHRHIEAGDLGSHVYNAWLAQLIQRGQAPGLWITRQWSNVFFDLLLVAFGSIFSLRTAEKIAVSLSVLIFFWGAFALVCAAARRIAWFVLPLIAMISYGWTFETGFFNYYLSLGLAFFGVALFWRGAEWERALGIGLAPFAYIAHPLGMVWLVATAVYVGIAEKIRYRFHWVLFVASAALLRLVHVYFFRHYTYVVEPNAPFYFFNGADQLRLFSAKYIGIETGLLVFAVMCVGVDVWSRHREAEMWRGYSIPVQLFLIAEAAVVLLPDSIHFPRFPAAVAMLTERLTLVSAVLICCILGAMRPQKWQGIGFALIAAVFFTFLYRDTGIIDRMESRTEQLVRTLPPRQRVLGTIMPLPGSRVMIQHILDRACVGYCFSYGNYEPPSMQFRVRAGPENSLVMTNAKFASSMEKGTYRVQPQDLPAWQIYQCSLSGTELCVALLEAGHDNDEMGVHRDKPRVSGFPSKPR